MPSPSSFYKDKIDQHQNELHILQRRFTLVAILRAFVFVLLVFAVYHLFRVSSAYWISLAGVSLAGFILLVRIYFRLKDKKLLVEKLLFVNTNEQKILHNETNDFPDGRGLLDSDSYLDDLDIFGHRSLFHLLNRTTTSHGNEKLGGLLKQSMLQPQEILRTQAAVKVLTPQAELRQLMTAKGLLAGESKGNLHSMVEWLSTPPRLYDKKGLLVLRWILVICNLGAILYYLGSDNARPMAAGVLMSWLFTGIFTKYVSQQHILIAKKQAILDQYAAILAIFNRTEASDAPLLQEWQARTKKAHKAIRHLSRLSAFFDQRMNVLVNFFLNSFLLYDLWCMTALEKWKEMNRAAFPGWIAAVGDIECLNSLASFAFNNPLYSYPTPLSGPELFIGAKDLAHPLIPADQGVANDLSIGKAQRLILVTGSNMSGKTTFLRTIGVNILLAQCGAPVCASSFSFTPADLLTSLRVSDSLQEQTSYFMAELKKLQRIIHFLQSGRPALVLIDEILRGTNSEDKTYGSEQFIRKLLGYHCLSLFATHDLSLGSLEAELPLSVSNYCFESVIEGGELRFDYRLQRGVARNRNASFLMKKMEII